MLYSCPFSIMTHHQQKDFPVAEAYPDLVTPHILLMERNGPSLQPQQCSREPSTETQPGAS